MPEDPQSSAGAPTGAPGQRPSDGNDGVPSPQSSEPEIANPEAKKYADEAARLRIDFKAAQKELADLRTFKQQQEEAKLSSDEKRDKALAAAQERAAQAEERAQRVAVTAEVKLLVRDLGIKTELAMRLLDFAEIEFDENGEPTNLPKLMEQLVTKYGLGTVSTAAANGNGSNGRAAAPRQPTSVGSTPANPARSSTGGAPVGGWNWENMPRNQAEMNALSPAQQAEITRFINAEMARSRR